jgi:hypothetical protein
MLKLIKLTTSIGTAETIMVPEDPRIMEITQVLIDEFAEEEEEQEATSLSPLCTIPAPIKISNPLSKNNTKFYNIN